MIAEAVEVLAAQPPGPELVSAITYASGRRMFTGEDAEVSRGQIGRRARAPS